MKTIKALADEIGCSKQAVMQKIADLKINKETLPKDGNKFLVDEDLENLIKQAFSERTPSNSPITSPSDWQMLREVIDDLRLQLSEKEEDWKIRLQEKERELRAQLDDKDKTIEYLKNLVAEEKAEKDNYTQLLNRSQYLQMVAEQKVLKLEAQKEPPKKWWQRLLGGGE